MTKSKVSFRFGYRKKSFMENFGMGGRGGGGGHYGTKCVNWMSECEIKENHTNQLIIQEFNFVVSVATLSISFLLSYIFLYSILIRVALFLVLIYNV